MGALLEGPAHGYELRRRLGRGIGPIWRIPQSQLYQLLKRLREEGLLEVREMREGNRPPRRVYSLTPSGRGELLSWLTEPVRRVRDIRVEFLAKLYFLRRFAPDLIPDLISSQREWLSRLRERLSAMESLPVDDPLIGRLALSFRLSQVRAILAWLEEVEGEIGKEV